MALKGSGDLLGTENYQLFLVNKLLGVPDSNLIAEVSSLVGIRLEALLQPQCPIC